MEKYERQQAVFAGRKSFSKTDADATFMRKRGELRLPRARGRRRLRQAQRVLPRVPQREMVRRRDDGRQLGARRELRRARLPGGPDACLLRGIAAGVGPGLRERGADIRARGLLGLLPKGEVLEVDADSPKRIQVNPALNAFKKPRRRDAAHRYRVRLAEEALRRRGDRVRRHQEKPRVHEVHAKGP